MKLKVISRPSRLLSYLASVAEPREVLGQIAMLNEPDLEVDRGPECCYQIDKARRSDVLFCAVATWPSEITTDTVLSWDGPSGPIFLPAAYLSFPVYKEDNEVALSTTTLSCSGPTGSLCACLIRLVGGDHEVPQPRRTSGLATGGPAGDQRRVRQFRNGLEVSTAEENVSSVSFFPRNLSRADCYCRSCWYWKSTIASRPVVVPLPENTWLDSPTIAPLSSGRFSRKS